MTRWLYHVARITDVTFTKDHDGRDRYRPSSLAREGFIHASYRDLVLESARLYFVNDPPEDLRILAIDPRRLDVSVDVASTPRGPMPHIEGPILRDACVRILAIDEFLDQPDVVTDD